VFILDGLLRLTGCLIKRSSNFFINRDSYFILSFDLSAFESGNIDVSISKESLFNILGEVLAICDSCGKIE
jgi:hypothetical protein